MSTLPARRKGLMSGPLNAAVDPNTDLRYYAFNDLRLLSATSIRRQLGMPFPLAAWQVNQVLAAAAMARGTAASEALSDTEYKKSLRRSATQVRDKAANLGTAIHEAAEHNIRAASLDENDERKPFLQAYESWQSTMKPRILVQEGQVFHLTERYAGSLDLIAEVDGRTYVIDLKTGRGTYPDHAVQLALYTGAEFIGGFDATLDKDVEYPVQTDALKSADAMAILHLRPTGWKWIEIPLTDELAAAAIDMVRLAHFYGRHPDIDSLLDASRTKEGT